MDRDLNALLSSEGWVGRARAALRKDNSNFRFSLQRIGPILPEASSVPVLTARQ
jgi:hypothetical protein